MSFALIRISTCCFRPCVSNFQSTDKFEDGPRSSSGHGATGMRPVVKRDEFNVLIVLDVAFDGDFKNQHSFDVQ